MKVQQCFARSLAIICGQHNYILYQFFFQQIGVIRSELRKIYDVEPQPQDEDSVLLSFRLPNSHRLDCVFPKSANTKVIKCVVAILFPGYISSRASPLEDVLPTLEVTIVFSLCPSFFTDYLHDVVGKGLTSTVLFACYAVNNGCILSQECF